jgi:3-deoxy-7-phosphoheptulonate synthase
MSTNNQQPSSEAHPRTHDLRIAGYRPLIPPTILMEELPLGVEAAKVVDKSRDEFVKILHGQDDRLAVVVGPCSVHDTKAALEYAQRLAVSAQKYSEDLMIIMRVYFEKPRTTVGWRGLINDPYLNGTYAVNDGLRMARSLLIDVLNLGLPTACEFLDPISPQFFADAVTWAAIGARTTESQVHRNLASGLSMPVGFKNGTGGGIQMAIDAIRAAAASHSFLSVTEHGLAAIVSTNGNPDCHVVLRGGRNGPNHDAASVQGALQLIRAVDVNPRLMIDASHENSGKDYRRQPGVAREIAAQVAEGENGIVALMLESFLVEGRQDLKEGQKDLLVYGQSITDSCISWETTETLFEELAAAVRARRSKN